MIRADSAERGPLGKGGKEIGETMKDDMELEPGMLETDHVYVRSLKQEDLEHIVRIEQKSTGRARGEYYGLKVKAALEETGVRISLIAELDERPVGFLMGQVFYGEFGQPEPVAIVDSISVDPDYRQQKVGEALIRQLNTNLAGLGIEKIQTQVDWNQWDLLQFFAKEGFEPAPRVCLEKHLARRP